MGDEEDGTPFFEIVHRRILCELSLVGILKKTRRDGEPLTKKELLEELYWLLLTERDAIRQIGRLAAGEVYGMMEDRKSSVATVDYVMWTDIYGHYHNLLKEKGEL